MASPDGLVIGCAVAAGVVFGLPAAIISVVIAIAIRIAAGRISGWRLFAIVALVAIGSVRHPEPFSVNDATDILASDRARGTIDSIPVARPNGDRAILHVDQVRLNGEWRSADLRVVVYLPDNRDVTVGDGVEVVWSFGSLDAMPPGFAGYIKSQDAVGSASIWSVQVASPSTSPRRYLVDLRRNVSARILELVPGDSGALMSGIVTGDDSALSIEARAAFTRTGTGHITAVSGSNIAMLLAIWSRAFRSRTRRHHMLVQLAIVGSIWAYCISTGLEPSALRATTVATLVVWSGRFGRRADPLTVLALASGGLLLLEPSLARSVGFWLSVTAAGAIAGSFPFVPAMGLRAARRRRL